MSNRLEREIEEILGKLDELPAERKPIPLRRRRTRTRWNRLLAKLPPLPRFNPSSMMLAGIGLILSALLFRMFSTSLATWAALIGLGLFFASFVLSFMQGRGGGPSGGSGGDVYWRGQRYTRTEFRGPPSNPLRRMWRRNRRG